MERVFWGFAPSRIHWAGVFVMRISSISVMGVGLYRILLSFLILFIIYLLSHLCFSQIQLFLTRENPVNQTIIINCKLFNNDETLTY